MAAVVAPGQVLLDSARKLAERLVVAVVDLPVADQGHEVLVLDAAGRLKPVVFSLVVPFCG